MPSRALAAVAFFTLLGSVVTGGAACAKPEPIRLGPPARAYRPADYPTAVERWTRQGTVIRYLDTALHVHATYLSPDFRAAYAERYIEAYRLKGAEAAQVRASQQAAAQAVNEFYLAVSSTRVHWNQLEKKDSIWQITLVDDRGLEVRPTHIKAEKAPSAREQAFYPYVNEFKRTYVVKFPVLAVDGNPLLGPGRRWFALRFASPLGQLELRWNVAGP